MVIQLVEINIPYVFKRYSQKYNIYRDLYEIDLLALEIRNIDETLAENTRHIIFRNKEICYHKKISNNSHVDLLILGSFVIFRELSKDITAVGNEDLGHKIGLLLNNYCSRSQLSLKINSKSLSLKESKIMGIVNVTPDSFSDGGKFIDKDTAITHASQMIENGATIIDVGGESTRPNAEIISEDEELKRVIPVIEGIINLHSDAIISIDTTKSIVAKEAISAGASIVNDISAMTFDKKMIDVVRDKKVTVVLMHMKGTPLTMQKHPYYEDPVQEIYDYLDERIKFAEKNGITKIIIDPGIGFGKRVEDNFEILNRLQEFRGLNKPLLVGLSRKSFLGKTLDLDVNDRKEPTLIAETLALHNGADIIRTHEINQTLTAINILSNTATMDISLHVGNI